MHPVDELEPEVSAEFRASIPADHPALAGHFPARPIVPGTLLLDEVLQAFGRWRGGTEQPRIVSAKFLLPVPPAAELTIVLREIGLSRVRFEGRLDGAVALTGELAAASEPCRN